MKKLIPVLALTALSLQATAQISITAADMPVSGDTLRYSTAVAAGLGTTTTGAGSVWDFSTATPLIQAVDTYKTAAQVSPLYAFTISSSAYGYKLGDSIPGASALIPISTSNIYNFFEKKTSPSRYVNESFAATLSGLPAAFNYSDEDEWYFFPLNYGNADTSTYKLTMSIPSIGSFSRQGTRTTTVDGWGTIVTPYYTTPVSCIRLRSQTDEVDSVNFNGITFGLPMTTVEYKWLVAGEHYPAMWITATSMNGNETNTAARYRDSARSTILAVPSVQQPVQTLTVYPSPAHSTITLQLPAAWQQYQISVYDMQGKAVLTAGTKTISIEKLPAGTYLIRAVSGTDQGIARFTKN